MKTKYLIIIGLVLLTIGFFVGRSTITSSVITKYVKGSEIHDSVRIPIPYNVYIPTVPALPIKPDTFYINSVRYITLKVDTAKIIYNYIQRKRYTTPLFDNNNGKLIVSSVVQYNSLDSLGYKFTPITKEITITRTKIFTPFINASYNSFGYYGAGGGIYINNIGIGAKYLTDFTNKGYELSFGFKF